MYIVFSLYLAREQGTVRCDVPLPPQFSGRLYRPTSIWESGNHPTICQPSPLRPRCFVTAAVAVDCTSPTHSPGGVPVQDEDIAMGAATDNS